MTDIDIDNYASSLYSRVDEAKLLNREVIDLGEWKAKLNMCHHNVSELHLFNNRFTPVRGWLYLDHPGFTNVTFVAHSAIKTPENELIDITPSGTPRDYPFIDGNLSEE